MVPCYFCEDDYATHYWDRIGRHYCYCHEQDGSRDCWACNKTMSFMCYRLEIGAMTRWPKDVHKLTLAEQAEVLLLHPEIASYDECWDADEWPEFGLPHEEDE